MINVDKLCDIELPPAAPERQLQGAATTHDIYIYIYIYIYTHLTSVQISIRKDSCVSEAGKHPAESRPP